MTKLDVWLGVSRASGFVCFLPLPALSCPRGTEKEITIEARINRQITVPQVRLVTVDGQQVGVVPTVKALALAQDMALDLVEVAPTADPPVCKVMDYAKWRYEQEQRAREARRNQVRTIVHEIKLRPRIADHDYATKAGHVRRFIERGAKVKITVMFRGRENSKPELGYRLLDRIATDMADIAVVESRPVKDGRDMVMILTPQRTASGRRAVAA